MTIPVLKIKVLAVPKIKGKMDVRFPARIQVVTPILLDNSGGVLTFSMDINALIAMLAPTFQPNESIDQHITSAGPVSINANTGIARVDQTVGAAITLNLPLAANKTCPAIIADWKGDATTNNITILPSGSEKINGRSSWLIATNRGSVYFRPIPGVGYVV